MIEALLFAITGTLIVVTFTDIAQDYKLAVGRWILHLIRWKSQAQRVYEQLQLSYSDEAVAGMVALGEALRAAGITLGAQHEEIEPYQPQPEYEEMLPAPADWKPKS